MSSLWNFPHLNAYMSINCKPAREPSHVSHVSLPVSLATTAHEQRPQNHEGIMSQQLISLARWCPLSSAVVLLWR